jgi:predicted transglutaminase-like cysteine proteinase
MSTIQSLCITRRSAICWALGLGLFLAAALPLLAPLRSPADRAGSVPLFDSSQIEAVSFIEDTPSEITSEPEPPTPKSNEQAAPLFGMETEPLVAGMVLEKWSRARAEIARELEAVDQCRASHACPADAQRLIDLSAEGAARSGRAKVGLINRAVDLAISPVSDETQWGVPDHWSPPFETLRSGRGDCEDYAIVKYLALLGAGFSKDDVKIVVLKNVFPNEDHAVAAVRVNDQWLILDNRTLTLVRDKDLTRAIPELVLDQGGVRRFVSKGRNRRPIS